MSGRTMWNKYNIVPQSPDIACFHRSGSKSNLAIYTSVLTEEMHINPLISQNQILIKQSLMVN